MVAMDSVPIMLLSAEGRQDIVELWHLIKQAAWPECPITRVDVLDRSNTLGWTKQLKGYLAGLDSKFLLLWVDDSYCSAPVRAAEVEAAFAAFAGHSNLAVAKLGSVSSGLRLTAEPVPLPDLPAYGWVPVANEPSTSIPMPAFWRTRALLDAAEQVLSLFQNPKQDWGWAGFYNYELQSYEILKKANWGCMFRIAKNRLAAPLVTTNGVRQAKWGSHAHSLARHWNLDFDFSGREDFTGDNWCSDVWREAGRPHRA